MKIKDPISTRDAATLLGMSRRNVRHLIARGHLAAEPMGRDRFLSRRAVEAYARNPVKSGPRPKAG